MRKQTSWDTSGKDIKPECKPIDAPRRYQNGQQDNGRLNGRPTSDYEMILLRRIVGHSECTLRSRSDMLMLLTTSKQYIAIVHHEFTTTK